MKKLTILVLFLGILFLFVGCTDRKSENLNNQATEDLKESLTSTPIFCDWDKCKASSDVSNARLIVNGKDITDGNYIYIDFDTQVVELPVLAILRELGYEIELQHNPQTDIYTVENGHLLTTEKANFGIGPEKGTIGCVREFRNQEFIVDLCCMDALIYWKYQANFTVDYENATVEFSSHPSLYNTGVVNPRIGKINIFICICVVCMIVVVSVWVIIKRRNRYF